MDQPEDFEPRVSLNLRIDSEKYAMMERLRTTGFGISKTERNRSDVYNEIIGFGLQVHFIKQELGERDFQKFWELIHKLNIGALDIESVGKLLVGKDKK